MSRRPHPDQHDLLSWEPPQVVKAYAPERVRAATLAGQLSKAISAAMQESGKSRDEIAEELSAYLGEKVSVDMLDKYASEAAESHIMNVVRFVGLLGVTRDRALLEHIAEPFGWAVIERRYLPAIEYASRLELERGLRKVRKRLGQQLRSDGVL